MIDLTNDTCTLPTLEMQEAMQTAKLGDDIMDGDPATLELEKLTAELFGKEAGLFVVTPEMTNQLAVFFYCQKGDEIILSENSRLYKEGGASTAIITGAQFNICPQEMEKAQIETRIRPHSDYVESLHKPYTKLICLQIARNDGSILPLENIKAAHEVSKANKIPIHIDGFKIVNASLSEGIQLKEYASYADSISIDLIDCLRAPLGSVLLGTKEFIERAKRARKLMGGALRQSGIYACCGTVSILKEIGNVQKYNEKALEFWNFLSDFQAFQLLQKTKLNFVVFSLKESLEKYQKAVSLLLEKGIKIPNANSLNEKVSIFFHSEVTEESFQELKKVLSEVLNN